MIKPDKLFFVKILSDFLPVLIFIITYQIKGFHIAAYTMVVALLFSIVVLYLIDKTIPIFSLLVALITVTFALISIFTKSEGVLIFRDTFFDLFFFLYILVKLIDGKYALKELFGHVINISDEKWKNISFIWGCYFLASALCNELIRISGSINMWINFKVLVVFITTALGIVTIYYVHNEKYSG